MTFDFNHGCYHRRLLRIVLLWALTISLAGGVTAQTNLDVASLIERGKRQLQAARATDTEEAYQQAEEYFAQAIVLAPKNAVALLYHGMARMNHAGWLAKQGRYEESNTLTNKGLEDMDGAVKLAPDDLEVRLMRGTSYAQFPAFMNKNLLAREDLQLVTRHVKFGSLPPETRANAFYTLGRVYSVAGQADLAAEAWRAAVLASPNGKSGVAAQAELEKLKGAITATDPAGNRMPDRFPRITADQSPIIVSASVTFPDHAGGWRRSELPKTMQDFLERLSRQPGLLGTHLLSSVDRDGMLVILTWWQDKRALNDWFYSETHQGIIKQYYGGGAPTTGARMSGSSQVGIELFAMLPGGMRFGGGLTPEKIAQK